MGKIIAVILGKIADGSFGAGPKAAYWWLAGKKTYIAVALSIAAFSLGQLSDNNLCTQCAQFNTYIYSASVFLASIGLIDGALRTPAPKP